ncbi:MAG TPA: helix-turn-helix transcriptional regulator, partial [Polyangiaceae bacterium LLY-WYZ-15_(1-7)]|nr:helix-turn-helix transcriptional regulator [Polyangiaceae bacterium LLY-WYZ-15_(1-7)]
AVERRTAEVPVHPFVYRDAVLRDLGRRVAELRTRRGWTQQVFAEKADFSVKYLQRIESGRANLSVRSLVKLAAVLAVGVAELFAPPESRDARRGRPPKG